jgi:hypothetical protein
MKTLIQHIFGTKKTKKSSELLAWVETLSDMEEISALQFATKQLSILLMQEGQAETLTIEEKTDFILSLEVLNQKRLEKLATQMAFASNMKRELEDSIYETCYNYCRQSYIFHLKVIEKVYDNTHPSHELNVKPADNHLVMIIARALNAALNMLKWRLFSQANQPAKMWLQINVLYKIASQKALLNNVVELFDLSPSTSLAALYVQTCMMGQLAQTSMQNSHIEITAKILSTLLTRVHISNKYTPEQYLFYVDLEQDAPAKRMRDLTPYDTCRYWELDELEKVLSMAVTVSDRGEIPKSLALAKIHHIQRLNETVRILVDEWRRNGYVRQRRQSVRTASSRTAKVNAGIAEICNQVHQSNRINSRLGLSHDEAAFDARVRAHTVLKQASALAPNSGSLDTWIITDESPRGYGARVNKYANLLARPDKLIGLVIDQNTSKIAIGMIRSVKPTQGGQLRVGIEVLSNKPVWVQLRALKNSQLFTNSAIKIEELKDAHNINISATVDIGNFSGIYLPIEEGLSEKETLILPKMNFIANNNYLLTVYGAEKYVFLANPIEARDDWLKVEVKI